MLGFRQSCSGSECQMRIFQRVCNAVREFVRPDREWSNILASMPTAPGGHAAVRASGTTDAPPADADRRTDVPVPPLALPPGTESSALLVPTARPAPLGAPSIAPGSTKMRSTLPYAAP